MKNWQKKWIKVLANVATLLAVCLGASSSQAQNISPQTYPLKPETSQQATSTKESTSAPTVEIKPPPRYESLGKSVRGRTIEAIIYGTGKRRVVVIGGIHGDEPATTVVARALAVTLGRDSVPAALTVIILPDANPDGLSSGTRVNGAGVDINRNFPSSSWRVNYEDTIHYPGAAPASEPETRSIMSLLERHPPDLLITLHAALGCVNWDGPAERIAAVMARVNGYPLCSYLGYETPGSLGTYAGIDRRIPMVTIELRDTNAVDLVKENLPALIIALNDFASTAPP